MIEDELVELGDVGVFEEGEAAGVVDFDDVDVVDVGLDVGETEAVAVEVEGVGDVDESVLGFDLGDGLSDGLVWWNVFLEIEADDFAGVGEDFFAGDDAVWMLLVEL